MAGITAYPAVEATVQGAFGADQSFEAAASADKQLITFPNAGHGMSYLVDRERMQAALEAFLDRLCPKN